jgi:hypothetical protein
VAKPIEAQALFAALSAATEADDEFPSLNGEGQAA